MYRFKILLILIFLSFFAKAQRNSDFADSIRVRYNIPELGYAVVSSDSVLTMEVLGVQRIYTNYNAKLNDRFHLGSNTKAITAFIAALLVDKGKLSWNTKFLDLFPELKNISKKDYYNITLKDLLSFRGKLDGYSYGDTQPTKSDIGNDINTARYNMAKYFLAQAPMSANENGLTPSNVDYILAGLMLEKASHESYKKLVSDFGKSIGISFGFDYPNQTDSLQPWGHNPNLEPVPTFDNYKLNWLLSAGNINVSLPDYTKFIQFQLKGLAGRSQILSPKVFNRLLYGFPIFAFGWFNKIDKATGHHIAFNEGNAGAFITKVEIIKEINKAYIVFTNAATDETNEGIRVLIDDLKNEYGR